MNVELKDSSLRSSRWELPLALSLFVAAAALVDPRGNFPLLDDWDFAIATWRFADSGEFQFTPFTAVSLRLQVLWGAAWSRVFGKSFEVLRISTLFLSAASIVVFQRFLARLPLPRRARVVSLLAFAFHPIFFWASFTYMTHVPYLFMSLLAMVCFWRGLSEERRGFVLAGAACVIGSYFVRQTGFVNALPPLFLLGALRSRVSRRWKEFLIITSFPLVLFAVLFVFTDLLFGSRGEFMKHLATAKGGGLEQLAFGLGSYPLANFANAGLFLLPLAVAFLLSLRLSGRMRVLFALVVGLFVAKAALEIVPGFALPVWSPLLSYDVLPGNVLVNLGLGPMLLRDIRVFGYPYPWHMGFAGRLLVTLLAAIVGGASLFALLTGWWRSRDLTRDAAIAARLAVIHVLTASSVLCLSAMYWDRYALDSTWTLAILLPLLIRWDKAAVFRIASALVVFTAICSTVGTREYLEWNRARSVAFESLRRNGIPYQQIDAGYEVNAMARLSDPASPPESEWSVRDDYILTFHDEIPGYRAVRRIPYQSMAGMRTGFIHVLERVEDSRGYRSTKWR